MKRLLQTLLIVFVFSFLFIFEAKAEECYQFEDNLIFSPLAEIVSRHQSEEEINNLQSILVDEDFLEEGTGTYGLETVRALEDFQNEKDIDSQSKVVEKGIIFTGELKSYFNQKYGCEKPVEKEARNLLIIVSNNGIIPTEFTNLYESAEPLANFVLAQIFNASQSELADLSLEEIVVKHGEPFVVDKYINAIGDETYEETTVLTGKEASYENFKKTLRDLDEKEGITDLLINLHGTEEELLFHSGEVSKTEIPKDLTSKNIGFVYQTTCHGSENMDIWTDIGAEVVNGAKGRNDFVIYSPAIFLEDWTKGDSFKEAVEIAYNREKETLTNYTNLLPGVSLNEESSKMLFEGNVDYKLKK
ncbi:MAG: hypothetical protein ACQEP3_03095 [Patescibacteria group bacterium]